MGRLFMWLHHRLGLGQAPNYAEWASCNAAGGFENSRLCMPKPRRKVTTSTWSAAVESSSPIDVGVENAVQDIEPTHMMGLWLPRCIGVGTIDEDSRNGREFGGL